MLFLSLQSGSNGNCLYVEAGGKRLLFDAGISGKRAAERLAVHGRDIRAVDALFISHDHADHVSGAGIFHRLFGLTVHMTERTWLAGRQRCRLGTMAEPIRFTAGGTIDLGGVVVETLATPHDAVEGVAFVVDDGRHRLGICTDLGHVFAGLGDLVAGCDALVLESNYDPGLLARGSYPAFLKARISGPGGHLANEEAASLVADRASPRLRWLCLAHLSEENNDPAVALATHRRILGEDLPVAIASRHGVGEPLALE